MIRRGDEPLRNKWCPTHPLAKGLQYINKKSDQISGHFSRKKNSFKKTEIFEKRRITSGSGFQRAFVSTRNFGAHMNYKQAKKFPTLSILESGSF